MEMEKYKQHQQKPNSERKYFNVNKYKKQYGSVQEGQRLGFLNKNTIKKNYFKEERQKQKFHHHEEGEVPSFSAGNNHEDPYSKYEEDREAFDLLPSKKRKISKLQKAKMEYENKIKEKKLKKKEREDKIKESENRRKMIKEKRLARNIKLSKKTKSGQPLMRSRMEVLLGDIESLISKGN